MDSLKKEELSSKSPAKFRRVLIGQCRTTWAYIYWKPGFRRPNKLLYVCMLHILYYTVLPFRDGARYDRGGCRRGINTLCTAVVDECPTIDLSHSQKGTIKKGTIQMGTIYTNVPSARCLL